jgi:hypothetical protein
MTRQTKLLVLSSALLLFFSTPAYANAGTPLMWGSALHLAFGNLFIGIGEGLLLGLLFRLPKLRTIAVMIFANYFSALTGWIILNFVQPAIDTSITLYEIQWFIWAAYAIAFAYTLIAEAPLIYMVMRKKQRPILRTIIASLVIQTLSYAGILYWYTGISYDDLFQNAHIVRSFDSQYPKCRVYYVGEDKNVYQMNIDGTKKRMIFETPEKHKRVVIYMQQGQTGVNLCLSHQNDIYNTPDENYTVVKENILPFDRLDVINGDEHFVAEADAIDYRPPQQRQWKISTGFWAAQGLYFWNDKTGDYFSIAMETPFIQWYVRSATVLPGDEVIFQFGRQVCIYSRQTKNISLLTKGTSPVVILDQNISDETIEHTPNRQRSPQ